MKTKRETLSEFVLRVKRADVREKRREINRARYERSYKRGSK